MPNANEGRMTNANDELSCAGDEARRAATQGLSGGPRRTAIDERIKGSLSAISAT